MDDYSDDLMRSVANSNIGSLAEEYSVDGLDSLIDQIINNEIMNHIPIIKTIIGISKGILTIRDRNYLKRVFFFLFQTNKVSDEAKEKFRKKLKDNPKEVKKAGETIWEILDSFSSSKKSPMIGKVFESYMNDEITVEQLTHISEMIDKAYLQDLIGLEQGDSINYYNLVNVGIMRAVPAEEIMKHIQENTDRNMGLGLRGMSPALPQPITNQAGYTKEGSDLVRILRNY